MNSTVSNTTQTAYPELPEFWEDLWKLDRPLDFQAFLKSDLLATHRNQHAKTISIIQSVVGGFSLLSSSALLYHILHSHKGLSTTYHRLVFGLCVADMMSSFVTALSTTMSPKEMNYYIPFAQGNVISCTVQGYFGYVGLGCSICYNCSICLYYLAIILHNKKDEFIKKKLEPWFHGVSITIPLILNLNTLALKAFNNNDGMGVCGVQAPSYYHSPPHCIGYDNEVTLEGFTIPCGRSNLNNRSLGNFLIAMGYGCVFFVPPIVIIGSMGLMYGSMRKIEKKIKSYGAGALRLRVSRAQKEMTRSMRNGSGDNNSVAPASSTTDADEVNNRPRLVIFAKIKNAIMHILPSCFGSRDKPVSRSNIATSQKRAILQMASGYSLAWFLTLFLPLIFHTFFPRGYFADDIILRGITPLQGFFNLIVYMAPKVRSAKNIKRAKLSWSQAIGKAWKSKGEQRREMSTRRKLQKRRWSMLYKKV